MRSTVIAVALVVAAPFLVPQPRRVAAQGRVGRWWSAAQANIEASEYHVTGHREGLPTCGGVPGAEPGPRLPDVLRRAGDPRDRGRSRRRRGVGPVPRPLGAPGATEAAGARACSSTGSVRDDRGPIVEWFVNDAKGPTGAPSVRRRREWSPEPAGRRPRPDGHARADAERGRRGDDFVVPGGQRVIHTRSSLRVTPRDRTARGGMQGFCEGGLAASASSWTTATGRIESRRPAGDEPAWTDHRSGESAIGGAAGDVTATGTAK